MRVELSSIAADGPIVLVGAGNMGGAMMRGWIEAGIAGKDILIVDPGLSDAMRDYARQHDIGLADAAPAGTMAGVLFVAVKPQMMGKVLPGLRGMVGERTVAVSVAAGTTLDFLERHLGEAAVVRAMPNTPAMVGRGITAAVGNARVDKDRRSKVDTLLSVSGPVEWLEDEASIDAVTAVSGSGPAYAFYLVECMAEAGRKQGLDPDLAMRLARATVSGAGELMHRSDEDVTALRRNVTSPNGTTAAALDVLMADDGIQPVFDRAVAAARRRAEELSRGE